MLSEETRYRLLKTLEANPTASQRELARELDISLGKVNYCLKALVDKGWVKMGNFRRNPDKGTYAYLLTPKGAAEKARVTMSFLQRKLTEYESIKDEIAQLQREVGALQDD